MRRWKKKTFSFLWIVVALLITANNMAVFAKESGVVTKSYSFTTRNKKERHDDEFAQEVKENRKTYMLQDISYEIVKSTPVVSEKIIIKTVDSDYIKSGESYNPPQTITENGITYHFNKKETLENNETRTQPVTGYTDYDVPITATDVPAKKEVTIISSITGGPVMVIASLLGVERLADGEWIDTYIDITFQSYDADIFEWQGYQVAKNEIYPLQGYENVVLASVGANTGEYRINSIEWDGGTYVAADGTLCRNAVADVQRYVNFYRANYSGILNESKGIKYRSIYKGVETTKSNTEHDYEMEAVATYVIKKSSIPALVAAGVGILFVIGFIIAILFILKKKKSDERKPVAERRQNG